MDKSKQQYISIKGTKSGLTLHLDDTCSFSDLLAELDEKLSLKHYQDNDGALLGVRLQVGNRYITEKQEEALRHLIREKKQLVVESIDSNVITKQHALEWKRDNEILSASKIVRSGQVLQVPGDLLLIGDVNPGGKVVAGGNIYIMGALRGIAFAGCYGNKDAVIVASVMKPSQIKISDIIGRSPDYYGNDGNEMECAYIGANDQIVVDRLQQLAQIRPNLTRLERGIE